MAPLALIPQPAPNADDEEELYYTPEPPAQYVGILNEDNMKLLIPQKFSSARLWRPVCAHFRWNDNFLDTAFPAPSDCWVNTNVGITYYNLATCISHQLQRLPSYRASTTHVHDTCLR